MTFDEVYNALCDVDDEFDNALGTSQFGVHLRKLGVVEELSWPTKWSKR